MVIKYTDITQRVSKLNSPQRNGMYMREAKLYTTEGTFCENNAVNSIKNWESLAESKDSAFLKALDVFEELCDHSTESIIRTNVDILVEAVSKVRDQLQLQRSLAYRMGRMRQKTSTSTKRLFNDVTSKINANIANMNNVFKPSPPTAAVNVPQATDIAASKRADIKSECLNMIAEESKKMKECDRIIENYSKISKRFNIDRIITEVSSDDGCHDACFLIAQCVDTFSIPFKNKYNSALETAAYAFDKHYMNYPRNRIIEAVTDYFIISGAMKEEHIPEVKSVCEKTVYFDHDDFCDIEWMWSEDTSNYEPVVKSDDFLAIAEGYGTDYLAEADLKSKINDAIKKGKKTKKEVNKFNKDMKKAAKEGNPEEHRDDKIKADIDDFRLKCLKDKENKSNLPNLKGIISNLFAKNPYQIVYELPNLFGIIRAGFVLTSFAANPIIGVVAMLGNEMLKIHFSRKQIEKIYKAYEKEIKTVEDKLKKTKDKQTEENLNKYLAQLKKDIKKIEEYERELYTEEDNDVRDAAKSASEVEDDDEDWDDDDWDDEDWEDWDDDDFEEAANIILISDYMQAISEGLIDDSVEGIVFNNIFKLPNDSIDDITDFSITVPVILEKEKLAEALSAHREELRYVNGNRDYMRINCINENLHKLKNSADSYNTTNTPRDAMLYLACLNELCKIQSDYITEMEFTNTIKLAINNLKKKAVKLKDKDKQISSSIDVAANNTAKSIEDAMMSGNREAVIKGRMIPSASKCIKLAISTGVAWAINPAVAVIGAIGAFACQKKLQAKERQIVLDDIEIELKMCERYLRQAEDEGDMNKVRQIEIIQRNLQRQRQRIKYKMQVVYHQPAPKIGDDYDD